MDTEGELQAPPRALATWARRIAFVLALTFLILTVVNATWWADAPRGYVKLLAHRGVSQQFDHAGISDETCTATRIETPVQDYLENTLGSISMARRLGAQMVQVDVAPTADGKLVLFHDWTLDCRTNGKGPIRERTLAEIKALDAGYGYSADGGKTFPFRGKAIGGIPALEDALATAQTTPLLYNLKSKSPAEADLLIAALKAAGRDVEGLGDGFNAAPALADRLRAAFPKAWVWGKDSAKACTKDYLKYGWLTITPESCRNGTLMVPLNYQLVFAGWPNLTQERMAKVGARIVVTGPYGEEHAGTGLDLPEQVGKVPASFRGFVWIDDIWTVGPALRPDYNKRRPFEEEALAKALAARRALRN